VGALTGFPVVPALRFCDVIKAAHRHAANMVGAKIPRTRKDEVPRQPAE
jgi:hypothetical protein